MGKKKGYDICEAESNNQLKTESDVSRETISFTQQDYDGIGIWFTLLILNNYIVFLSILLAILNRKIDDDENQQIEDRQSQEKENTVKRVSLVIIVGKIDEQGEKIHSFCFLSFNNPIIIHR